MGLKLVGFKWKKVSVTKMRKFWSRVTVFMEINVIYLWFDR